MQFSLMHHEVLRIKRRILPQLAFWKHLSSLTLKKFPKRGSRQGSTSYDRGMNQLSALPFDLTASHEGSWKIDPAGETLSARALPKSDLYRNPAGDFLSDEKSSLNALTLIGTPTSADFQLSAKVTVDFDSDYDAGALLVWSDSKRWAKLCFEYSPDKEFMVVSVVTQLASDDVNSYVLPVNHVWLRISRIGHLYALHSSSDGAVWKLIRAYTLGVDTSTHKIGFVAQAPIGEGCDVQFSDIKYLPQTLKALRDGS